jgi:hypothetical protein
MREAPTSARLKHDIDRGRGGDKVDVIDPAAVPLGTDDEAAGTPPTPHELATAHGSEIRLDNQRYGRADWGIPIYLALLATVACVVLGGLLLL